ncbi:MAG: tRNA 2-selenouridine(34) synthase MnmH [Gammaproteobacteria bacterium]|nr:tRNA 2-selenouridine(34) synthase MnmH [Gammaproteobacteria bacterium]
MNSIAPTSLGTNSFDEIFLSNTPLLDLRSPGEFAQGAFPTSINLPLMDDEQRHQVGKCYKESGQAAAVKLGHQLVSGDVLSERMQQWLAFAKKNPDGRLYCFRGGLRSQIVQSWLRDAGVEMPRIDGGYKALRRFLISTLERGAGTLPMVVLAGRTGSGKTLLLQTLNRHIDLEALARHRGSSFGAVTDPQPTIINFENQLAVQVLHMLQRPALPVFLEDEGRLIGRVSMPEVFRVAMLSYPAVILDVPLEQRVEISLQAYILELQQMYTDQVGRAAGLDAFAEHHRAGLQKISKRFGSTRVADTLSLFESALRQQIQTESVEGYRAYIATLLRDYYDPMYDYQISQKQRPILMRGSADEIRDWLATHPDGSWYRYEKTSLA